MKRLSSTITQKQLRTLAAKHGMQETSSSGEKVDSPLMKVDSSGNITCIICRTRLKSANIWKVHVNSKGHKNNVQAAKELKTKLITTNRVQVGTQCETKSKNLKSANVVDNNPIISENVTVPMSNETITTTPHDPLPSTFFDSSVADTKGSITNNKDAEWELFQKEIKEVTETAYEIFVADQKDLAVEKELVEIDEQIQHWSKVLDLEEKRKCLNKVNGKNRSAKMVDESESSESEDFEEYTDWRSKVFK